MKKIFKKRSKIVFASLIVGLLYLVYIGQYFFGAVASTTGSEQIGAGLATAMVMPHMFMLGLGIIFNFIAFLLNKKWACITALILYCVSALVFFLYAPFLIPNIILASIGIGKISKINSINSIE